ncbi:MAG: hypothetical protein A2749_00695 [Parcubacteria group bacterium RIFCSPHIGHO2_01_FULL_45_26]|nr:MAG: hypothetical protein A2749_00695 [Parcubacteria group bacterium RIFCSPHIGHO2_01_FULL_45_26]
MTCLLPFFGRVRDALLPAHACGKVNSSHGNAFRLPGVWELLLRAVLGTIGVSTKPVFPLPLLMLQFSEQSLEANILGTFPVKPKSVIQSRDQQCSCDKHCLPPIFREREIGSLSWMPERIFAPPAKPLLGLKNPFSNRLQGYHGLAK